MRTTGRFDFRRRTAARIACAIVAIAVWNARESAADPVQPDPLGLLFCNGGAGTQTPIGIEPPYPLAPGSCVKTQTDDYTVVGGYYDQQCAVAGASSMQEQSASGYQVGIASLGFGSGTFGSLATAELSADHGGPAAARTWGYFADEVTISGGSGHGTFVVPLHVTGSSYVIATRMTGVPDPVVHAGISIQCVESTSPVTTCNGMLLDFSSQTNLPNMPTPIDQTIDMTIPFDFGTPADFAIYACSVATMAAYTTLAGTVSVDFSHTGVIEKATVLDALGDEVPGATVASVSGFDYLKAPGGTTTTTVTATSTTMTSTTAVGASTTSTTLAPCSVGGLMGVECLLGSLPPAAVCENDSLPPGFAKQVRKANSATTAALHASSAGRRWRLLHKLDGLLASADRIATKATHKKKAPVSTGCAAAIHAALMQAESLVAAARAGQ